MTDLEKNYISLLSGDIQVTEIISIYRLNEKDTTVNIIYVNDDGFIKHGFITNYRVLIMLGDEDYIIFKRANKHVKYRGKTYELLYMSPNDVKLDGFTKIAVLSGGFPDLINSYMHEIEIDYTISNFDVIDDIL